MIRTTSNNNDSQGSTSTRSTRGADSNHTPGFLRSRIRSGPSAARIVFLSSMGIALLGVSRLHTTALVAVMSETASGIGSGSERRPDPDEPLASRVDKLFRFHRNVGKVIEERFDADAARQDGFSAELTRLERRIAALEASVSSSQSASSVTNNNNNNNNNGSNRRKDIALKVHFWDDTTSEKAREEILVREGWLEYNGGSSRSEKKRKKNDESGPRDHTQLSIRPWFVRTDDPSQADIIVWITTMGRHELEKAPLDWARHFHKVIVLDYSDGCIIHRKREDMLRKETELAYFKRSFVNKFGGKYDNKGNCSNDESILPFSYSGTKAMLIPPYSSAASLETEVDLFGNGVGTVYLASETDPSSSSAEKIHRETTTADRRRDDSDHDYFWDYRYENFLVPFGRRKWTLTNVLATVENENGDPSSSHSRSPHRIRTNVVRWTHEFCRAKTGSNGATALGKLPRPPGTTNNGDGDDPGFAAYVGLVPSGCDGHCFGSNYLRHLRDAKIVVTCNPAGWEGDFRLWESFLSGAMVMVDEMIVPRWMPHPPIDGVHFVTYQAGNETDFKTKLAYYSDPSNLDETEAIAKRGYKHVLQHHMPTNRVDYILNHNRVRSSLIESVTDPIKRARLGFPPVNP